MQRRIMNIRHERCEKTRAWLLMDMMMGRKKAIQARSILTNPY